MGLRSQKSIYPWIFNLREFMNSDFITKFSLKGLGFKLTTIRIEEDKVWDLFIPSQKKLIHLDILFYKKILNYTTKFRKRLKNTIQF